MRTKAIYKVIAGYFLRGLLYTVPLAITVYIIYQIFVFLDNLLADLIPYNIPGLGILILLVFITLMGFLGSTIIGQPVVNYLESLLNRIPLLKTLYTAITDLLGAFVGTKKRFNQPVLVKMNRESEIEKLGFITTEDLSRLGIEGGKIAVYMPHSYNFSGNLFIVPRTNVTPIHHNTADVMKFIISGGVTELNEE